MNNTLNPNEETQIITQLSDPISSNNELLNDQPNKKWILVKWLFNIFINIILFLILFILTILLDLDLLKPTTIRGFFKDNRSIQLPHLQHETINTAVLIVLSLVIPVLAILFVDIIQILVSIFIDRRRFKNTNSYPLLFLRTAQSISIFFLGLLVVLLITTILKHFIGRLRPDFIARCIPDYSGVPGDYVPPSVQATVCTGVKKIILEGRKSFPSGHSSISSYAMIFSTLYFETIDRRTIASSIKPTFQLFFIFIAILCSVTRITDNVHHPTDVLSGWILGLIGAFYIEFNIRRRHDIPMDEILPLKKENKDI